ncbi:biotin-dependent carboxyltransferase family protein [Nonomuraea deserti]|uniref:5-oxoprolinase subunit C family protein n=1 Tax=Nonomuraea deserti TaxID=1848322 RepID=UPI00268B41DD
MSVPQGCFVVHSPGSLALVQDLGRPGYAALGVPHAGAADVPAYRLANRLVGNGEDAACLEVTFGGLAGEFSRGRWFALTGVDADARLDGDPVAPNAPRYARPGQRLRLGHPRCGVRTYLAFAGGIDVPPVLGSRSADLMSGLGPPPLRAGLRLPLGSPPGSALTVDLAPVAGLPAAPVLDVVPGPRDDWFSEDALRLLTSVPYTVAAEANRVGIRLSGPALGRARTRGAAVGGHGDGSPPGAARGPADPLPERIRPQAVVP